MDYSNDLNPFETWGLYYYKLCFPSRLVAMLALDLKPKILWEMAMILSSDKLNWSQGVGAWLINLQAWSKNILYEAIFLLEIYVASLSVNTTTCLVYLNCVFGSDFILAELTSTCIWQLLWIKDTRYYFVSFSMLCSILCLISFILILASPSMTWQRYGYYILYSLSCHERECQVCIRVFQ